MRRTLRLCSSLSSTIPQPHIVENVVPCTVKAFRNPSKTFRSTRRMRFCAPRSCSPSPVRGRPRSSTFGIQSDSDSEEYDSELDSSRDSDDNDDTVSIASSSSSELALVSDINKMSIRPRHISRTPMEERQIEETVAAIRLRTRYHDPYEQWERQTRKDAFKTARKDFATTQTRLLDVQEKKRALEEQLIAARYAEASADVVMRLNLFKQQQQLDANKMWENWKARDRDLWQRIEAVIKMEEEKAAKAAEEERKRREEEERLRKEAELKKRLAEEKKLQEETARRKAEEEKKKQEEERALKEKEEEEKRKQLEEEKKRKLVEEEELRRTLHFNSADDDWRVARENLLKLKSTSIRTVKSNKEMKAEWGKLRRQIVPKVGQLTNDAQAINQISQQLVEIVRPSNRAAHHPDIYIAACHSLAKSILLQAETEVTAEKRSAIPLAQVAFNLLITLEHFPSIFFAKLVQRCGGWPVPLVIPQQDVDGKPWPSQELYRKASGWRKSESNEGVESPLEFSNRVSAVMRVYFHVLKIRPVQGPLEPMFQLPKFWAWFSRVTGDTRMLQDAVAPQLIYTGLDVLGLDAKDVWGQQWIKVLALLHEGITTGYEPGKLIGGESAEGAAARTRVLVALEDIVKGVQTS